MTKTREAAEAAAPVPSVDLAAELAEVGEAIRAAIGAVLDSGQFILGPTVEAFEREAAASLEVAHAVSLNSGTDALVLALRALGIGCGDEVVTTAYSFFATAEAIAMVGARPVFVDIRPDTFDLDVSRIEASVTERTKAVMPVHLYGQAADMGPLMELTRSRGLAVIEDTAQAFGARHAGRRLGTLGDIGTYSFYPSKNLGAYGDGGMLVTDDAALAESARKLRNHGPRGDGKHDTIAYNSRLDALQAAILRVKLPYIDTWNAARARAADVYDALLAGDERFTIPTRRADGTHVFHQYTIRVKGGRPDGFVERVQAAGVGARVYYAEPLSEMPCFEPGPPTPEARRAADEVLALPIGPWIRPEQQERVVEVLRACQ